MALDIRAPPRLKREGAGQRMANLREDDRFQDAIREVWRDGHALIPQAWIEEWQEAHPVPAPESEGDDDGEDAAPELA